MTFNAAVTARSQPVIQSQPVTQNIPVGQAVTFSVTSMGGPASTYQWYHDGMAIAEATSASYTIAQVQVGDVGRYNVAVTNAGGTTMSAPAKLRIPGLLWGTGDNSSGEFGGEYPLTQLHAVANNVVDASATAEVSAYVKSDGTLWVMGYGAGDGSFGTGGIYSARAIAIDTNVVKVTTGGTQLLYLKADGTLWGAGRQVAGELGMGGAAAGAAQLWKAQLASDVVSMGAGSLFSVYLKSNGELWSSGRNASGQLGDGSTTARVDFSLMATDVAAVSTGGAHTLFIKNDGTLWGVGSNFSGALGDGTFTDRLTPILMASNVASCAASQSGGHSLYIKTDGTLWGVGNNAQGQLGDGTTTNRNSAVQMASEVSRVFAGGGGSFFLKQDGTLWATGRNDYGQTGNREATNLLIPAQVMSGVNRVAPGDMHTLFIRTDGTLLSVGRNTYGQLGNGVTTYRPTPLLITKDVVDVASGYRYTLFLKKDRTLWGMGRNDYGELGLNTGRYVAQPVQIAADVTAIAAGWQSFFIKTDGTLWGMGYNAVGQLGLGHTSNVATPTQITTDVADVATNSGQTLFLKTNGTLWAMGYNNQGQLGDGTQTQRNSPVQVATKVTAMAMGVAQSYFIKEDGTLWAMGGGPLGDGTNAASFTPVPIASQVRSVSRGRSHTLFLKTDNTLWGVGSNEANRINDTGHSEELSPYQIAANVVSYAAGENYSAYVLFDGSLFVRGRNLRGESGTGDPLSYYGFNAAIKDSPVLIRTGYYKTFYIQAENPSAALPVIARHPSGGAYPAGASISLLVNDPGDVLLAANGYQWRKDGVAIPGANNLRLYLPDFQTGDAGTYDAVLTNAAGSVVSAAVEVSLNTAPTAAVVMIYAPQQSYTGGTKGATFIETNPWGLPVVVTYNGSLNAPTEVGLYEVVATINDPAYSGWATSTFAVVRANQTISVPTIGNMPFTLSPVTLSPTAGFGMPVAISVLSGPATISGNQLTLAGAGLITLEFTQAGSQNYYAATPVVKSFTVTPNHQSWAAQQFTTTELADAAVSGPAADPDGDGLVNLVEYALGLGPKAADAAGLPEVGTTATEWVYTYTRPAERGDISYAVEASTDMASWSTSGVTHTWVSAAGGIETWRATYPLGTAANLFFRLKVQEN